MTLLLHIKSYPSQLKLSDFGNNKNKETNSALNFSGFISLKDLFVVFPTERFLKNHFCTVW